MKQTFAVVILMLIMIFVLIFLFIPSDNHVIVAINSKASAGAIQRSVSNKTLRAKWLPKEGKQVSDSEYVLDNCSFNFVSDYSMNSVVIVKYKGIKTNSTFNINNADGQTRTVLDFKIESSKNPFEKLSNYFNKTHIENTTQKIVDNLNKFISNKENIYGVDMNMIILQDSTLITLKRTSTKYPTSTEIYSCIKLLQDYASSNNADATNSPMLNIFKNEDSTFAFMVAIPIDTFLPNKGEIVGKRMFSGGKILVSGEIKGGLFTIDRFLNEIENYRLDELRNSPAIPFQSLKTNRSLETDTNKWITKLYYPVF